MTVAFCGFLPRLQRRVRNGFSPFSQWNLPELFMDHRISYADQRVNHGVLRWEVGKNNSNHKKHEKHEMERKRMD